MDVDSPIFFNYIITFTFTLKLNPHNNIIVTSTNIDQNKLMKRFFFFFFSFSWFKVSCG